MGWKNEHSFEKRYNDARRVKDKYPYRVPVICEQGEQQKSGKKSI